MKKKTIERSLYSQFEIIPLDKWEILPEQINYEEELGRGAFGVVYKATYTKRIGMEVFDTKISERTLLSTKTAPQVVAVKVLHDDPSDAQKEELTLEIEQMKLLGSHTNIVSLVGCHTLKDQNFLVIEYVPSGDLLTWLRRKRNELNKHRASDRAYDDKEFLKDQGETRDQESTLAKVQTKEAEKPQSNMEMTQEPQDDNEDTHDKASTSRHLHDEEKFKVTDRELLSSPQASTGTESQDAAMSLSIQNPDEGLTEDDNFSTQQLFSFAWQIAKGMNHLAENNLVHRDLAARNVLVGHGNQVKVSDFGLMRQIYEDVYSSRKSKKLPVKWMAPEALYQGVYTTKSDVWAYGVLLWEMSTLGGVPYPTLTNTELFRLLGTGYRMERPDMCSDEVYELMTHCWKEEPCSRPSFFQIIEKLEAIMQRDAPYLDVNKHNEAHPYYNVPPEASDDEDVNTEKADTQESENFKRNKDK
ncbi:unnamed protein product [Porites lobata]|uniref:Protein kinase domain-containing protein n=1 Tax=Porites lobata TaxID=104759 RepID=A0ABN8R6X3_9CNID|nr:unnamed protein product [Porites lobata]